MNQELNWKQAGGDQFAEYAVANETGDISVNLQLITIYDQTGNFHLLVVNMFGTIIVSIQSLSQKSINANTKSINRHFYLLWIFASAIGWWEVTIYHDF